MTKILRIIAGAMVALVAACSRAKVDTVLFITMESVSHGQTSLSHATFAATDTTPVELGTGFAPLLPEEVDDIGSLGVRFASAFAPSGSALPSLVNVFTGREPGAAGVYSDYDRLTSTPTLAESLSLRGIRCGAFVGRESLTEAAGLARGFETYVVKKRDALPAVGANEEGDLAAEARAWLDATRLARPDQPVFLWFHVSMARPPFKPDPTRLERFGNEKDLPLGTMAALQEYLGAGQSVSAAWRRSVAALHAACILQDSATIAKLLGTIAPTLNKFKKTMIIFAGTNGGPRGEGGTFTSRHSMRDSALHVPLTLWSPHLSGIPRVVAPVVSFSDITITIANAFGVPPPAGANGLDLLTSFKRPDAMARAVLSTSEGRIFSLRTARDRFICNPFRWSPGGPLRPSAPPVAEEWFDIALDPYEQNNLAPAGGERRAELRARVERERIKLNEKPPVREQDPARLAALRAEEIHEGDEHATGAAPVGGCGSK